MVFKKMYRPFFLFLLLFAVSGAFFDKAVAGYATDISDLSSGDQLLFTKIKEKMDDWAGEYEKVTEVQPMIQSFIASNPEFLPIYIEKARLAIMIGFTGKNDYIAANKEALKIIKEIQKKDPNYAKPYVLAGHVYQNLSDLNKAQESLTKAEQLGTDDPWLHLNWANMLYAQERYNEALTRAEMGLRSAANNSKALLAAFFIISRVAEKVGKDSYDIDATKIVFEQFNDPKKRLRIAERLIDSYGGRRDVLVHAYRILKKQKEETPDLPNVDLEFAHLFLIDGFIVRDDCVAKFKLEQAELSKKILLSLPDSEDIKDRKFAMLFNIYMSEKNLALAESSITNASLCNVDSKLLNRERALLSYKKRQYEQVIEIYNELLKEDPGYINDDVLLKSYQALGNVDLLHEYHKKNLQVAPNDAWTLGNYASFLLFTMQDIDGAVFYGKQALKRMDYPLARNLTGLALLLKACQAFDAGELNQAEEYYREAKDTQYNAGYLRKYCRNCCHQISAMQEIFEK